MAGSKGEDFTPGGTATGQIRARDWWARNSATVIVVIVLADAVEAVVAAVAFAVWAWKTVSPTVGIAAAGVEAQTAVVAAALFGHWLQHYRKPPSEDAPAVVTVIPLSKGPDVINLPAGESADQDKKS